MIDVTCSTVIMVSLKDKVVLITGSGDETGIGAATALHLVQYKPKLVLTGRNKDSLDKVGQLVKDKGQSEDDLLLVVADVTVDSDLRRLVQSTVDRFNRLDVLVNNAAALVYYVTLNTPMDDFDRIMNTNVRAPFYLTQLCLPHLIATKGCIINVSSMSGQLALSGVVTYSMSKAALDHFTAVLAMEVAKDGVRVNSVNPGVIRTNIQKKGGMTEAKYQEYVVQENLKHPLGRIGEPEEVAKAISFLASDESSFVTGQLLFVDGGRHKQHL